MSVVLTSAGLTAAGLTSAGLTSAGLISPFASALACAAKSDGEGGVTLAGSGTGTAASIASSAGVLVGPLWAKASGAIEMARVATVAASMPSIGPRTFL